MDLIKATFQAGDHIFAKTRKKNKFENYKVFLRKGMKPSRNCHWHFQSWCDRMFYDQVTISLFFLKKTYIENKGTIELNLVDQKLKKKNCWFLFLFFYFNIYLCVTTQSSFQQHCI